jgi:hypothetical protein
MSITSITLAAGFVLLGNTTLTPVFVTTASTPRSNSDNANLVIVTDEGGTILLRKRHISAAENAILEYGVRNGTTLCFHNLRRADHDNIHRASAVSLSCN